MEDPFFFEDLLNNVELVPLMDAVRPMQGLSFWHGSSRRQLIFDFVKVEPGVRTCLAWAESESCPQDARQELTLDQRAAIRAWTCTSLCYGLTSALRNTQRTLEGLNRSCRMPVYSSPRCMPCRKRTSLREAPFTVQSVG